MTLNLLALTTASLLAFTLPGCSDGQSDAPASFAPGMATAGSAANPPVAASSDSRQAPETDEGTSAGVETPSAPSRPPFVPVPPPASDSDDGVQPSLADGEWLRFQDEFSPEGCDLINGSDFEAIARPDGRLEIVSELAQDVGDRLLPALYLDEDFNLFRDGESASLGRVRFKHDEEGARRAWLLASDGSAWSAGEDAGSGAFPLGFTGVPCAACRFVDDRSEGACEAAIAAPLVNGEVQPAAIALPTIGVGVQGRRQRYSGPGVSCDAINGADVVLVDVEPGLLLVSEDAADVPDRALPDLDIQRTSTVLGDTLRGAWRLVVSGESGGVAAELLFSRDANEQLRLWLVSPDGRLVSRSTEGSTLAPSDVSDVPCNACPGPDGDFSTACD